MAFPQSNLSEEKKNRQIINQTSMTDKKDQIT